MEVALREREKCCYSSSTQIVVTSEGVASVEKAHYERDH